MNARLQKPLATLAVVIMIAAVGAAAATARPRASVTLTMMMASTQQIPMDILVANFERVYPDIDVQVTYIPSSTVPQVLLPQLQAGNAPDLFYMQSGRGGTAAVVPLAEAGRLLSLSNEVWETRLAKFVKPGVSYRGKLYAYPFALFVNAVAYNADLFKQLGLTVPTTFAQMLTMCKKITAAGKTPLIEGIAEAQNGALTMQQRMLQYVYSKNPNWNDLRDQKKTSFQTSPEWRRAFQTVVDMKDAGCYPTGMQGTTAQQQFTTFARGDAVMTLMASTQYANVTAITPGFHVGWFNLPGDTATQSRMIINGNMLGINSTTKHASEAKTFIRFLSRPKQAALYAKVSGGNSYYDILKGVLPSYMSALAPLVKANKVVWAPQTYWPNPALNPVVLGTGVQGLFTGQRTIDDLLKTADYLWDNPTATSAPS